MVIHAGQLLRRLRLGLKQYSSQQDFARKIGMQKSLLNMIEHGKRRLRGHHIQEIANSNLFGKSELDAINGQAVVDMASDEFGIDLHAIRSAPIEMAESFLTDFQEQRRAGFTSPIIRSFPKIIDRLQALHDQYRSDTYRIDRLVAKALVELLVLDLC
jgi:transcriptional regulator with XRE-family HTH domain